MTTDISTLIDEITKATDAYANSSERKLAELRKGIDDLNMGLDRDEDADFADIDTALAEVTKAGDDLENN